MFNINQGKFAPKPDIILDLYFRGLRQGPPARHQIDSRQLRLLQRIDSHLPVYH